MRVTRLSALLAVAIALAVQLMPKAQGREAAPPPDPNAIRVLAPGVISNSGLKDIVANYMKENPGVKVQIVGAGMGRILNDAKTLNPPVDIVTLPYDLMGSLALDGGMAAGTWTPLGRSEMGLAVPAGKPHPDISTVEKLAAVLKSAKAVMRSNPAGGSMVASTIRDKVINRPEFAGVNSPVSTNGEGGQALVRGQGDMALQAICEILPYKEIELVDKLPRELGAWIDMSAAITTRAAHKAEALKFLKYMTDAKNKAIWEKQGLERYE